MAELGLLGVDTAHWEFAGSSGSGGYYRVAQDVLVAVPEDGFVQTEESALRSLEVFEHIARTAGRRQAVIVLVDRVASQDAKSRRVWAGSRAEGLRASLALVCSSALARAIGSFFIGLNRPPIPTRMFATYGEGLAWSRAMVESHGGAL